MRHLLLCASLLVALPVAAEPVPAPPEQELRAPVQMMPVLVPCDEPGGACVQPVLQVPGLNMLPPRKLHISVSLTSGVLGAGVIFGPTFGPAAYLGADLRLLWRRAGKRVGLGLRFSGSKSLALTTHRDTRADVSGADVGFLFDVSGFWLSTGWGFGHYSEGSSGGYMPEAFFVLGYDISITQHFAFRLSAGFSTLLVTARGDLGGGLVFRF